MQQVQEVAACPRSSESHYAHVAQAGFFILRNSAWPQTHLPRRLPGYLHPGWGRAFPCYFASRAQGRRESYDVEWSHKPDF